MLKDKYKDNTHIEYRVLVHPDFFEHLHMKRLVIDNEIKYPMSTFNRMFRYAKYEYYPCRDTKIKIAKAMNNLDINDIEVDNNLYDGMD